MTPDSSLSRRPPQKPSNPSDNRPASCKASRQYRQLWTLYTLESEQALREGDERFRAVADQATVGVSGTDLTGRFTFANRRYCEIVGYAQEELLGMRMQDITHPEDLHAKFEQACYPEIVIIGLSVQAGHESHLAMLKAGAARLLTKEAAVDQLHHAIFQALARAADPAQ